MAGLTLVQEARRHLRSKRESIKTRSQSQKIALDKPPGWLKYDWSAREIGPRDKEIGANG